jgi:hypothetical protein
MARQLGADRLDPDAAAHIDQALATWDKKRSKLATKYLGRGIRKELNDRGIMDRMFPQVAILATLTEQPKVVTSIYQAFFEDMKYHSEMNFLGWTMVGPFRWCAEQLNLTGYHDFFDETIEYNGAKRHPASRAITRHITGDPYMNMDWLGTVEEAAPTWERSPVPRLDHLLGDMCITATYRQYPYYNDLGWSLDDFDAELREDTRFARAHLGFTPDMPTFPENPEIHLPEGMTQVPRLKWNS